MWGNIFPRSFENSKLYNLGLKAYFLGDFKGSVKCFKRIIEREPNVSSGWYMLLESLSYLGKWEEMIKFGKEAIKTHPNFGPSYSWLGDAYNQLGKRKQAEDCYERGLRLLEKELNLVEKEPFKYPRNTDATILNSLAEINIRLRNYEEAIEYSKRALNIKPDEHNFHSIGLAYKEMGDYDKAIEFYEKSLDVNPEHSYAWFDLGLIYQDLNESKKAIDCYEKAVKSSPQWVKLREKLLKLNPNSLALLKKAPDVRSQFDERIDQELIKSEILLDDLNEVENILKDNKLTVEERKYYEQRRLKLKKEFELDAVPKQDRLTQLKKLLSESRDLMLKIEKESNLERKRNLFQKLKDISKSVEKKRKEIYKTEKTIKSTFMIPITDLSPKDLRLLWELMKFSADDPTEFRELMKQEIDFFGDMAEKLQKVNEQLETDLNRFKKIGRKGKINKKEKKKRKSKRKI